tara:strand:+ start:61 stop:717 length:657 start_codon:yes stop_codon:yes gene_type:complete
MPISFKHKFKFIHIPKTGGSSVEVIFDLMHEENLYVPRWTHNHQGCLFAPQHFTHSMIDFYTKNEYEDWFSFTIVRDPYIRTISEFLYTHRLKTFNEDDFNEWLDGDLLEFNMEHTLPQSTFIDKPVDMILKLENINEDWGKLMDKLGTDFRMINDNDSRINKRKIFNGLKQSTKNKIYNIFKEDFDRFGYERSGLYTEILGDLEEWENVRMKNKNKL